MKALRTIALVVGMALAVALAVQYTPKQLYAANAKPDISLEALVPESFGDWAVDKSTPHEVVNPSVQEKLAIFYSETLSRIYVNNKGDRIMLSLAYGADQSRAMQVHKPEVCYEAQGFKITYARKDDPRIGLNVVPVMRLQANQDRRIEPITYWIRTGDYVVRGWWEQNVARVRNGLLKGYTPDGILVRVSSINDDREQGYKTQDEFMRQLVASASYPAKKMLLGELADPHATGK
jgi:EpsI family protein